MDDPARRRRWPPRLVLFGAALLVTLLATLALAPDQAGATVQPAIRALAGRLRQTMWTWPLAAALTLAALTSPLARRRWPQPARRVLPALGGFVGLAALTALAAARPRAILLVMGVVVIVGLLAAWVLVAPRRLAPPVPTEELDRLSDRDRLEVTDARVKLRNDLRTSALQTIIGLAVLAGAVLGFQQLAEDRRQAATDRDLTVQRLTEDRERAAADRDLTRQGQASERFTRAIDQLGSDRREVQIGGIFGLEQIAVQAPDTRQAVTYVLVAYLHRRIPRPAKPPPSPSSPDYIGPRDALAVRAPDAQTALDVLTRGSVVPPEQWLDLAELDLRGADLRGANLHDALLIGADLRGAVFESARVRPSNRIRYTDLSGAVLVGADLRGATLIHTDLHGAQVAENTRWPEGFAWQQAGVEQADSVP